MREEQAAVPGVAISLAGGESMWSIAPGRQSGGYPQQSGRFVRAPANSTAASITIAGDTVE
jgi:hypothetical protein